MTELINVEVAYALPQKQVLKALTVASGTTALLCTRPTMHRAKIGLVTLSNIEAVNENI